MPDALVACTLFVYWRYMLIEAVNLRIILRSLPAWGVRVEIVLDGGCRDGERSLPAWGVRVEMAATPSSMRLNRVTPRMGSAG